MSNDLTVSPATAAYAARDTPSQPGLSAGESAVQANQEAAVSPAPNPSLQLDVGLGLVVIEFRNDAGAVTNSIPSKRQMQAYQRWQTTHFGPAPHGMKATTAGSPVTVSPHRPAQEEPEPVKAVKGSFLVNLSFNSVGQSGIPFDRESTPALSARCFLRRKQTKTQQIVFCRTAVRPYPDCTCLELSYMHLLYNRGKVQ